MANGIMARADGDVIENLTVRHYAINGVLVIRSAFGCEAKAHGPETFSSNIEPRI